MTGKLTVIGLGPGPSEWLTPAARKALEDASDIFGYETYLRRIEARLGQTFHPTGNRVELDRARDALARAAQGASVAMVSSGDPGVFAMAAAIFEAVEQGSEAWRGLSIEVEPGITAMLAAAARAGAPLGHDFCAISLSDNLKPWAAIEKRLRLACEADFVIALYNPASKARPDGIGRAIGLMRQHKSPDTVMILARAVGAEDEQIHITSLAEVDPGQIDMSTLVIIGSSATRAIQRAGGRPWVYTPRSIAS
jgi:precorrin-3B C17-methyltransferase